MDHAVDEVGQLDERVALFGSKLRPIIKNSKFGYDAALVFVDLGRSSGRC